MVSGPGSEPSAAEDDEPSSGSRTKALSSTACRNSWESSFLTSGSSAERARTKITANTIRITRYHDALPLENAKPHHLLRRSSPARCSYSSALNSCRGERRLTRLVTLIGPGSAPKTRPSSRPSHQGFTLSETDAGPP